MNLFLTSEIIQTVVEQYKQFPSNQSVITILRKTRKYLAEFWLNTSSQDLKSNYFGEAGKAHKTLLKSGLKHELLDADEQDFVDGIIASISQRSKTIVAVQSVLAAMLYCRADQLPIRYQGARLPQWFFPDFLEFLLEFTPFFKQKGEIEQYCDRLEELIDFIHANILKHPTEKLWQDVAETFVKKANLVTLYFSQRNLRTVFTKRSNILESAFRNQGNELDWVLPQRSPARNKIRLGILKSQFLEHPETLTTIPLFEHLDRNKFEIILYVIQAKDSVLEQYCYSKADRVIQLIGELSEQVQTIRNDNLDILLVGSILTNSLHRAIAIALHRLARVQITYFASPATTGLRHIDYYLSGNLTEDSPLAEHHYSEKLVLLEGTGFCFHKPVSLEIPKRKYDRQRLKLSDRTIVYVSGANFFKIIPELRETWVKIIAAVSNSVLLLYPFGGTWSRAYPEMPFLNQMRTLLTQYGVDNRRLILLKTLPSPADVRECLKLADIYLDSYPYSGANSTLDPLEVGLPVVVREGKFLRARQSAAMLRDLQIPDLITDSEESYIQLAIALGTDRKLRQFYRSQIQERMQNQPRFLDSHHYGTQIGTLLEKLFATSLLDGSNLDRP